MKRISLPRLNAEEARLRQRIGAGQCFPYQLNDDAGALTLRLTSAAPASDALALRCDGGPLWIGEAESVLALLSDCPALPYAEAALTPGTGRCSTGDQPADRHAARRAGA